MSFYLYEILEQAESSLWVKNQKSGDLWGWRQGLTERDRRELSVVIVIFFVLIWICVTHVYAFVETQQICA